MCCSTKSFIINRHHFPSLVTFGLFFHFLFLLLMSPKVREGKAFSYKINNFLSNEWSDGLLRDDHSKRKLNFVRENALSGHKVKRWKKKSIKVCSFSFPLWSTHWFLFRKSLNWPLNLSFSMIFLKENERKRSVGT